MSVKTMLCLFRRDSSFRRITRGITRGRFFRTQTLKSPLVSSMILRTGRLKENMFSRYKVFYVIFATIVAAIILTSCGTQAENGQKSENDAKQDVEKTDYSASVTENPIVTITMENDG